MRALITRPEEDAAPLAEALAAKGVDVLIEPLLTIRPLEDAPVDLEGVQALLFTSANGVRAFAARSDRRDIGVLTVGDGSAAAARAAGFTHVESAGGDVNDLVRLVKARLDPQNGALFHAAGSVVAGDLAGQLSAAGYDLRRVTLYEAKPAESLSPEARAALADRSIDIALFFSPRTASTFVDLVRRTEDPRITAGCAEATALCLSPAVAEAVGALTWAGIRSAEKPDLPSMLRLVDTAVEPVPAPAAEPVPLPSDRTEEPRPGPPPIPPAPALRQRSGVGAAILTAAIVAALVTLAGLATEPLWRPHLAGLLPATSAPGADPELAARVESMEAEAAELTQRIAALQGMMQQLDARAAGTGSDISDIAGRLEAVQQETQALREELDGLRAVPPAQAMESSIPPEVAALPQQVAELRRQLDEIGRQATATPTGSSPETEAALDELNQQMAGLDGLRAQVEALETATRSFEAWIATVDSRLQAVEALEARLAGLENATTAAEDRATGNAALALAVNQLQAALASQRPFTAELAALSQLAAGDPEVGELRQALAGLEARAETGVPTLVELRARFPEVARAVVAAARAEAAASTIASATSKDGTSEGAAGWLDAAMLKLSELVSVRPVGEDVTGDDPAARVARAEAALAKGDLGGAIAEVEGLAGRAAEAAGPWLADARARAEVEAVIARLHSVTLARLSPPSGGG